ncbi:MAG: thiamine phosphate synthase [Endomicrobia bacterium]|nr:thiamine phosphate synthase [Endomicrobiia bacterium]MDW8055287.1 thiamine phosphate synthase [Elusimicrobiota bacterium]
MRIKGLYCILPELNSILEYTDFVKKLVKFRPNLIQLRIKQKSDRFFYDLAKKIKDILKNKDILFIIDDRIDIAISINADGVHLGQDDISPLVARKIAKSCGLKNFIIGFSTHSYEQAKKALKLPVDYISIGPIFETLSKPEYEPVGVETLHRVKLLAYKNKVPVVAIGGINQNNVDDIKRNGADAVAVISAISQLDPIVIKKIKSLYD